MKIVVSMEKKKAYIKEYAEKNKKEIRERSHEWYLKNKERLLIYRKKHREENKEHYREISKKYYEKVKNTPEFKDRIEKYYNENRENIRLKKFKKKIEVLNHYGGKCVCCGETIPEFLTFDHINNDGNEQRKKYGRRDWTYVLINNKFPKDIQILCYNCNMAKQFHKICPHQRKK